MSSQRGWGLSCVRARACVRPYARTRARAPARATRTRTPTRESISGKSGARLARLAIASGWRSGNGTAPGPFNLTSAALIG